MFISYHSCSNFFQSLIFIFLSLCLQLVYESLLNPDNPEIIAQEHQV